MKVRQLKVNPVRGTITAKYPEVVHLSRAYCSAVAVGPDILLTVEHCFVQPHDHVWDGSGAHVGKTTAAIARCRDGLAIWRVATDPDRTLYPVTPDVSDLMDYATVRLVGCGQWPLLTKAYVDGTAHAVSSGGIAHPQSWLAKLEGGFACKGDSGGAAYTTTMSEKLAGIIEAGSDKQSASEVVLHRLDESVWAWVNSSIANYGGSVLEARPP